MTHSTLQPQHGYPCHGLPPTLMRFRIAHLLVFTTGASAFFAILAYDYHQATSRIAVVNALEELGSEVVYDIELDGELIKRNEKGMMRTPFQRMLGERGVCVNYIILNPQYKRTKARGVSISDEQVASLSRLENLSVLDMRGTDVTDAALSHLFESSELKLLLITDSAITDVGIAELKHHLPRCLVYNL